jgi:hypothetical protein
VNWPVKRGRFDLVYSELTIPKLDQDIKDHGCDAAECGKFLSLPPTTANLRIEALTSINV